MLSNFEPTPVMMKNHKPDRRGVWRWALLASLVVHLAVFALVMPRSLVSPLPEEQPITVELVPDPEPKAKAEAAPAAKEPKSEELQKAKAQMPPPASSDDGSKASSTPIKPVIRFGDKDAGPRKAPDGKSAEDSSTAPKERRDMETQKPPQASTVNAAVTASQTTQPRASEMPTLKPVDPVKMLKDLQRPEDMSLFSEDATTAPTAMTAIRDTPRGERAGQLCLTELRDQLLGASPPFSPDYLPLDRLKEGNVVEVPRTAFRSNLQWYDLSYRCEVDAGATKVTNFTFQVGAPIPQSEWTSRGLPSE